MAMPNNLDSTAGCLHYDERPVTPHNVRKFRKSFNAEPGKRVTHFGSIDDNKQLLDRVGGKRLGSRSSADSAHVSDVFNNVNSGSISEFVNERNSSIYRTVQREPLGKPYVRGHVYSQDMEKKIPTQNGGRAGMEAKELIYSMPLGDDEEEGKNRELYKKSHNSYNPGEQKRRQYDWKKVDPKMHRFGVVDKTQSDDGVAYCLQPDLSKDVTHLSSIAVDNFRNANSDKLGRSRNRRMTAPDKDKLEPSKTPIELTQHRRRKNTQPHWTAHESIQGNYSVEEQQPDKDLGKAIRPGWRNNQNNIERTFGCPTVRNDITPPARRSLNDSQNYGDDTNASKLLYPSRFTHIGVDDTDFTVPRSKDELRTIFENIGEKHSEEEFQRCHERAVQIYGINNETSLEGFRKVVNELKDAQDRHQKPHWWKPW